MMILQEFEISLLDCLNTNEEGQSESLPDIGLLAHQNAAAVLHFLRTRWLSGEIYVSSIFSGTSLILNSNS